MILGKKAGFSPAFFYLKRFRTQKRNRFLPVPVNTNLIIE